MEEKDLPSKRKLNKTDDFFKKKYNKQSFETKIDEFSQKNYKNQSFETDLMEYFSMMKDLCPDFCIKLKKKLDTIKVVTIMYNDLNEETTTDDNDETNEEECYTTECSQIPFGSTIIFAQITPHNFFPETTTKEENDDEQSDNDEDDYNDYNEYDEETHKVKEDSFNDGEDTSEGIDTSIENSISNEPGHEFRKKTSWQSLNKIHRKDRLLPKTKVLKKPKTNIVKYEHYPNVKIKNKQSKFSKTINRKEKTVKSIVFKNAKKVEATSEPLIKSKKKQINNKRLRKLHNKNLHNMKKEQTKSWLQKKIADRNRNYNRKHNYRYNNYVMID